MQVGTSTNEPMEVGPTVPYTDKLVMPKVGVVKMGLRELRSLAEAIGIRKASPTTNGRWSNH